MKNPRRGELTLKFGDREIDGKITLDTIVRIENSLGYSIVLAMRKVSEGNLTISEIMAILGPVLKAGSEHIEEAELKRLIWAYGIADAMREVSNILMTALVAGDQGNAEAEEAPQ